MDKLVLDDANKDGTVDSENLKHISFMDAQYSQEFVFMSAIASLLEVCPKKQPSCSLLFLISA